MKWDICGERGCGVKSDGELDFGEGDGLRDGGER